MLDAPDRARRSTRCVLHGVLTLILALLPASVWLAGSHGAGVSAQAARAPQYACPMHPDVRMDTPGVCPRCGMKLVPGGAVSNARYVLEVVTQPKTPVASRTMRLQLVVRQTDSGEVVTNFAEVHERLFHLFVVSDDLTYFDHIHPELQKDGALQVDTTLPHDGRYQLYADFVPQGGTPQFLAYTLWPGGGIRVQRGRRYGNCGRIGERERRPAGRRDLGSRGTLRFGVEI